MFQARNRLVRACSLALALFATVAGAQAAEPAEKGQFYGIFGSTYMGRDDDFALDSFLQAQLGVGGRVTDALALELIYTRGVSETNIGGNNFDLDLDGWRLDAVYDFGGELIRPYIVGGAGVLEYAPQVIGGSSDTGQFNLGGGVMIPATKRLASRFDVRAFYVHDTQEIQPAASLSLTYVLAGPQWDFGDGDADGDGVIDKADQCPGTAPGVDVDASGCPRDDDRDGVINADDACPRTPAGVQVDRRGCALDSDRDGVPDHLDACPDTPRGDEVDERGCTIVEEIDLSIDLYVEFDYDSDVLRPQYNPEILAVASVLKANSDLVLILEGHTDSRGSERYNQALSERRAMAVKQHFVNAHGISARRIETVGFGETQPISSNDTVDGRDRNRRVTARLELRD